MSDGHADGPRDRFDDAEVRLILSRAAELNERRGVGRSVSGDRLDLQQLREVAAEAGIDPDLVNIAAHEIREVQTAEADAPNARSGPVGRYRHRLETTVPGALTPDRLEWVLRAIRSAAGEKGEIDHVGGQMEWKGESHKLTVAVGTRGGNTRIQVSSDMTDSMQAFRGITTAMGTFFGGGFVAAALDASGAGVLASFLVVGVVLYFLTGWFAERSAEDGRQKLRHILDSAAAAAADGAALPPGDGAG